MPEMMAKDKKAFVEVEDKKFVAIEIPTEKFINAPSVVSITSCT